jgi:molecular chaperone DnaK
MSSWHLNFKKLFQILCKPFIRFFTKFQALGDPHTQLKKTCEMLQNQLKAPQHREIAWRTYAKALLLARRCDRINLIQVIHQFDPLFGEYNPRAELSVGQALSFLLDAKPQSSQNLDAAWRLCQRLNEPASVREVEHQICIQLARLGDSNTLLAKLLQRHKEDFLKTTELSEILRSFLNTHFFQVTDPWKAFLEQIPPDQIPKIHQVYAVLDRNIEASELAEAAKDYRSAIRYITNLSGKRVALRRLELSHQLGDETVITEAHQKIAESFWQENNYIEALEHFQKTGEFERVSDCHQKLGELGRAIQLRPSITAEWMQEIRSTLENTIRLQIESQEFLSAIRVLKSVGNAWHKKSEDAEANRTQNLLIEAVRTARSAFSSELQASEGRQPKTDLFKRWSLLEEEAGNYVEAGLQAEKAQDHFAASLLFEKAGAFGQALVALESSSPEDLDPKKKAQLLEQGGDFFMAGLLYERLGEIERAITMYEQAEEFQRAAALHRTQIGDVQILFDGRFRDLLIKAGRLEDLAELCVTKAYQTGCPSEEQARLWRNIKELAAQGLIGQKWLELAKTELPEIEAMDRKKFEAQAATWLQTASREVLMDYTDAIGLDLGTSNSVVCLYNKKTGKPEVVEGRGQRQIPSVFAIDQSGQELVGVTISKLLSKSPRAIITKAKREMGTDRKFRAGGRDYRAEEISAYIINHARQFARDYLQRKIADRVSKIASKRMGSTPPVEWVSEYLEKYPPVIPLPDGVITVPAYFNDAQKQATKTAALLADIHILRLMHEPTAACIAHWNDRNKAEKILVADLGAGTFDLSLIESGDGVFEVLQIEGNNALGSADLDELIYAHFDEFVRVEVGQDIPRNSQASTRLHQACEELKIELSSHTNWTIDLPYLVGDQTLQLTLTRDELERIALNWLNQIRTTCQKIKDSKYKPDRVLLIGGGGLTPAVRRCIQNVFNLEPVSDLDPLTAVARGAALQAAICSDDVKNVLLLDATPFSLGIKCRVESGTNEFSSIIPKHTTIPTAKTQQYTTTEDNQTQVRIEVFQGESSIPEENFKIGDFTLEGIPKEKAGAPKIDVRFDIDANCLLTITARDVATGKQQSITIADSHLLTPAQADSLQARFKDAQEYQASRASLEKLTTELTGQLDKVKNVDIFGLSMRFRDRIQTYEQYRNRYLPTAIDNNTLLEIYSERNQIEDKTRLALDQWDTLSRSVRLWIENYRALNWRSTEIVHQVQILVEEGNRLRQRTDNSGTDIIDIAAQYQRWLSVIESLPLNPEGSAEELAQHFLSLKRYAESLTQFQRIDTPLSLTQVELGLEILGRSRQREAYTEMLTEYAERFDIHSPDFGNLNHSVRIYSSSVVLIEVNLGGFPVSGSGFFISPHYVATNRHVLIDEKTGNCAEPDALSVMTSEGALRVISISLPTWGVDDVALLQVESTSTSIMPLRLGFSELVEVGERIMTIGFPAPERSGFEENLYCNTGLVNRIRKSQFCTERVLEVSIPLQGGISGSPLLNQLGEVIGLLTFLTERKQELSSGQTYSEQSFYSIPVDLLRRLYAEVKN